MPSVGKTLRHIPYARLLIVAELLLLVREHMRKLEPHERRRLVELVRRARGRTSNLSERERRELARLVEKAEPRLFVGNAVEKLAGFSLRRRGRGGEEPLS